MRLFPLIWLTGIAAAALTIMPATGRAEGPATGALAVYNWSNYVGETTIPDFEKEFNVHVSYDNYSSNEELLAKLQAGAGGYDVVFPSDYMVAIMIKQGLLEAIPKDKLPNLGAIDPEFLNQPYDPDNAHCVPYLWGTSGIAYNSSKVHEPISSWKVLWDPRFKGRISMLDDVRSGMIPALKRLGFSVNTVKGDEIERAKALMLEQKPLVHAYSSDTYIDLLRSGEVWIAYGFSGDVYQAARDNKDIHYVIPEEGTEMWIDNVCIPKGAPHRDEAIRFIDYLLRPKVALAVALATHYATPNASAKKELPQSHLADPNLYPPPAVAAKSEILKDLGKDIDLFEDAWSAVKAE